MITANLPDGTVMLILDPDVVNILKSGEVVPLPEFKMVLGYVPDAPFVEREMEKAKHQFGWRQLGQLLDEANKRPEVRAGKVSSLTGSKILKPS